jgi:hydrogenase expression/formation protein HypC
MCIAFPGKVMEIDDDNRAVIDIGGTRREVSLDIMDEPVALGDFVLCHAGFAIRKVDEADASERLEMLREILQA